MDPLLALVVFVLGAGVAAALVPLLVLAPIAVSEGIKKTLDIIGKHGGMRM
jgi:hypothetical protein